MILLEVKVKSRDSKSCKERIENLGQILVEIRVIDN